jgi:hypothetical protein
MPSPVLLCACLVMIAVACTPKSKKDTAAPADPGNEIGLTVVRSVKQDSLYASIDTLLRDTRINCSACPVDLYFCRDSLRVPLILPSGGFVRNKAQEKECNWEIYPATVRCCTYDSLGNVISMSINNSDATQEWKYTYDINNRVVECKGWWSVCRTDYDQQGRIARLTTQHNGKQEQYDFAYAQ